VKYRKKSLLLEATQWLTNGDHPEDGSELIEGETSKLTEGKIVRFFPPEALVENIPFCSECGNLMQRHGFLPDGRDGEQTICPGDYIVTDRNGFYYRLSRGEFESQYERWAPPPRDGKKIPPSDREQRRQQRDRHETPLR